MHGRGDKGVSSEEQILEKYGRNVQVLMCPNFSLCLISDSVHTGVQ